MMATTMAGAVLAVAHSSVPDFVGTVAGALTTVSFVPQVWRIWRRRSAADVSLGMLVLFTSGVVAWLGYGILIAATPVIAANAVTLVLVLCAIVLKLRYARGDRASAPSRASDGVEAGG
jgi:MtN3 and saliva related transmembrane protein